MSKAICEPIKLTVDSKNQVHDLIEALINNYDIYVKKIKVSKNNYSCVEITKFEITIYERNKDE